MSSTSRPGLHGVLSPKLLGEILRDHERYVRREAGGRRAVFKFVQLAGMDLSTRLLDDADFTAASMSRTRLIRASLLRASFFRTDLTRADLRGAAARRAAFRYTAFSFIGDSDGYHARNAGLRLLRGIETSMMRRCNIPLEHPLAVM